MSDASDQIKAAQEEGEQWLPIAELAALKGVARQTVWEKVTRLESQGQLATRPGPRGTKLVNVGEYEFCVRETADLAKEQAAYTANSEDPAYRNAQTKKVQMEAALKSYELRKIRGELVDVTSATEVIAEVGEELRKPLDQLPLRADEIDAAARSGGVVAVRAKLKEIVFELRSAFSDALRKLDLRSKSGSSSI